MKHIKTYIGMIVGLLAMLTSCSDSFVDDTPSKTEADKGLKVEFNISIPRYEETTRSITFGSNEGILEKKDMLLFCFDNSGQFVGLGEITEFENVPTNDVDANGSSPEKKIKASLPDKTSRIHFVANSEKQYQTVNMDSQADWVGMHENILMTTFETNYGEDQSQMTRYWGYVKRNTPQELKDYLNKTSNDHIVHLIRDRAKITAEWGGPEAERKDPIRITVINGLAYGTLAPFDRTNLVFPTTTGDENWKWDIDYITSPFSNKKLKGDRGQMTNPTYTFENRNLPDDPMKVIIEVNNKVYLLYLQDYKNIPFIVKRNYEYKIHIEKLDESLGYSNLEDALKSAPINNPWIKVEEIVPEISDANYSLGFPDGTFQMINEGSGTQTVTFKYTGEQNMKAEDFYATWIKNEQYATAEQPRVTSYDVNTGIGTISYQLNTIDNILREGTIHLIDTKHGLNKNVHLYSVSEIAYNFKVTAPSGKENGEGTLEFTVPANYPDAFMPVEVKVASNDINLKDCSVEVGDTKAETGYDWNCWFAYKDHTTGKHTVKLKNLRSVTSGTQGSLWLKAPNFNQGKAKKFDFTYQ